MARRVFYSFHYQRDSWRVSQIKQMGTIEGQTILTSNQWEDVAKGGDKAIQAWIDEQMQGKSCNVVLIGNQTAGRKWVEYEFKKAWAEGKGVLGVHIHRFKDHIGSTDLKGKNPFAGFELTDKNGRKVAFDSVVPVYDPIGFDSKAVYATIEDNIAAWVEDAIAVRNTWPK